MKQKCASVSIYNVLLIWSLGFGDLDLMFKVTAQLLKFKFKLELQIQDGFCWGTDICFL